jgi:hypothetical protein
MEFSSRDITPSAFGRLVAIFVTLCVGCVAPSGGILGAGNRAGGDVDAVRPDQLPTARYSYFEQPHRGDLWSAKIAGWQSRERVSSEVDGLAPVSGAGDEATLRVDLEAGDLRSKYDSFRRDQKRSVVRELAEWIQSEAKRHYVADGPIDHWATFEETLANNGDDCDGLELLAYYFLRDLGFSEDEVFRSIVYRPSDGQHHMVTLWFEDPEDPWVIDPTGAMTTGMPKMSEKPEWVPIKLFTENGEYSVVERRPVAPAVDEDAAVLARTAQTLR